jgi:oligoribonuclease
VHYPVVIDLETTHLEMDRGVILEFSMVLADRDLEIVEDFGSRVIHATEDELAVMNPFVTNMHTDTGLVDEVRASMLSIADIDEEAASWLAGHGFDHENYRNGIILGSSCRLDLNYIERHMPKLAGVMTYKMIDVSGMEEALRMWQPEMLPPEPYELAEQEGWTQHRAASDVRWSLEKARRLRTAIKNAFGLDALLAEARGAAS